MIPKEILPQHKNIDRDKVLLNKLYKLVNEEVKQLKPSRINYLKIKLFILPVIYLGLYGTLLFYTNHIWFFYLLYSLMGLMVVIIFSNLIHELCHGNIFKSPRHNSLAYYLFDLLGANSYIWQQRHLKLHHRYPNMNGWDADVEQKGPIAIFPHEGIKKFQRYQHRYVFVLYPLFFLNWLLVRDFRDYFSHNRVIRKAYEIPKVEYLKLFLFKSVYLLMILIVPWTITDFSIIQVLIGFLLLTFSGSILAMVILLTPHVNYDNEFPVMDDNGNISISWLRHQLITTNDISNTNWFIRNVMGNFNYHLAHHLFPRISSVYAPEVTQLVKTFLQENDLPYRSYPLGTSFKKHYQLIRGNAIRPD